VTAGRRMGGAWARTRAANRPRFGLHAEVVRRYGRLGDALYVLLMVGFTTAVAGGAAALLRRPVIFASLGPSVFLLFERPMEPEASPRNMLIGHGAALAVGAGAVWAFRLRHTSLDLHHGLSPTAILAAALSVALTEAILVLLRAPHPPAGATALIVGLGLLSTLHDVAYLALGVVLVTAVSWAVNRALAIPVPLWAPVALRPDESDGGQGPRAWPPDESGARPAREPDKNPAVRPAST
jgi:CBS domain-containing membrane protein